MNVPFFENPSARFPTNFICHSLYRCSKSFAINREIACLRCVTKCRFFLRLGSLSSYRVIFYMFRKVVRSSLEALIFLFLDNDTSCAPGWFHGQVPILLSIGDETFANSLEIPCERTMISKFVLSNGRRCWATRKTTFELNVVSSCCRIALLVGKKVTTLKVISLEIVIIKKEEKKETILVSY